MGKIMKRSCEDLPDECWESIFGRLDGNLQPISLVNKLFLTISGRLPTSLTLSPSSFSFHLPRLYSRFPNLRSIHLSHPHPDLDGFLRELAKSNLLLHSLRLSRQTTFPREAMRLLGSSSSRTLKTLSFYQLGWLTDDDLLVMADCFSYLHHLDLLLLSYIRFQDGRFFKGLTDVGICAISAKLVSLLSLSISFNDRISQQSFTSLSSNCPRLSHFTAAFGPHSPTSIEQFSSFAALSYLNLCWVTIDDNGLDQISKANLKLRKLVLNSPLCRYRASAAAMCRFLKSCESLTDLKLKYTHFSANIMPSDFVTSIPNVQAIHLCNVSFTETDLFYMLESCPNLSKIVLTMTYVQMVDYILHPPTHKSLRTLVLAGNGYCDETLALIGTICPNLESFYFGDVDKVTEQGTEAMKARCCKIKICKRIHNSVWREDSDSSSEEDD